MRALEIEKPVAKDTLEWLRDEDHGQEIRVKTVERFIELGLTMGEVMFLRTAVNTVNC